GRAGGVVAFLGGADDAIELERVARLRALAGDSAAIDLIGAGAGDAIARFLGRRGRNRNETEACRERGDPQDRPVSVPAHRAARPPSLSLPKTSTAADQRTFMGR